LEYNEALHQLFVDCNKAYSLVRRKVLYIILIEFGIPKKLVRLLKMCLNENYSRAQAGKHLSDMIPIRNGLEQGDALLPLLFNFALQYAILLLFFGLLVANAPDVPQPCGLLYYP
jgi:hypothetical protein